MAGIIIEGVAGAGKTSTLKALLTTASTQRSFKDTSHFSEDETFGELMDEMRDAKTQARDFCRRLRETTSKLQAREKSAGFLLERFHPSYYALRPDWSLYAETDRALHLLGGLVVLLIVPEKELESRFFERPERGGEGWTEGLRAYFGSKERAVEAAVESQRRRMECREFSRMPWIVIDTASKDWIGYALRISHEYELHRDKMKRI